MRKRGRKALQFKNYGELLYEEGRDLLAHRKKLVEQKKKEDAAKETEGMTWTPKIRCQILSCLLNTASVQEVRMPRGREGGLERWAMM